jgi:hypothetical protein
VKGSNQNQQCNKREDLLLSRRDIQQQAYGHPNKQRIV